MKSGWALSLAIVMTALGAAPAAAQYYPPGYYVLPYYPVRHHKIGYKPARNEAARVAKESFGDIPKGPLQIFISIDQQKLHLYSDGVHVADTSIATGVPSLPTPLGVFSVIQKQVFHRSNLYSNAPMPFMQRITWSGVAMHEGEGIGHPASHGCIRMPRDFAVRLYHVTRLGVPVVIARPELKPVEFADAHLFVHRDSPQEQPTTAPSASSAPGAASVADDAAPAAALGLRVSGPRSASAAPEPAVPDAAAPAVAPPPPVAAPPKPPSKAPIAIFISRKEKKIYVRQDFEPLFDAAVTIADPDKPLGTHVFTALAFAGAERTTLRWDVVSLPGEPPKWARAAADQRRDDRHGRTRREAESREKPGVAPPAQTPAEALARIEIPQSTIDFISGLTVPGSTLIVSDEGLGDETGEGTNFIVVTR